MKTYDDFLYETKLTLQYHDTLNPALWEGNQLKKAVRDKLLEIADAWIEYAKIPRQLVVDIFLTGGNANYNYTQFSDLDVHVLIDKTKLGASQFVDSYLKAHKELWSLTHKNTVVGFPVELYAQDIHEPFITEQGVFSLANNRWVQFPTNKRVTFNNDGQLKKKVLSFAHLIDRAIHDKMGEHVVDNLKDRIATMRRAGVSAGGEFAPENLIFKELRNRGYLNKLSKYQQSLRDNKLSLK